MYHCSIMKLTALLLLSALPAAAQTASPAKPPVHSAHHTGTTSATAGACVKIPEFSSKIPALPAGAPCAKHLYTITTIPSVKLDYVSPLEGPDFRESLGIESTSFSLDYVDTKIGTGEPAAGKKWYSIHYTGYLTDGTKFDSSVDRGEPLAVAYGQHKVIPGWDTGFGGMRIGGKRRLYIPYQLAYGPNGHGQIPAKAELIFDVELVAASDTEPEHKTPPPAAGAGRPRPLNLGPPNAPINGQPGSAPANAAPKPATPGTTPPASTTPPVADPTKPTAAPPASTTTPPPASTPPPAKP